MSRSSIGFAPMLSLVLLLSTAAVSYAHPFHISLAEVEFNAKTKRFEASLKLHALDLEKALSERAGRRIDIEKDPDSKELLAEYLAEHFYLADKGILKTDREGKVNLTAKVAHRSTVRFVGKELETTWIWLYFELETPKDLPIKGSELVLVNSVLLDITDGQINTLTVRNKGKKLSFKTTLKQPWAVLPAAD